MINRILELSEFSVYVIPFEEMHQVPDEDIEYLESVFYDHRLTAYGHLFEFPKQFRPERK